MIRSSNPTLGDKTFRDSRQGLAAADHSVMTLGGTVNKSLLLIAILMATGAYAWTQLPPSSGYMIGSALVGLGLVFVISFKKTWAPYLAPVYAAVEGIFLGLITLVFETRYPGIASQAVGLTCFVFVALLLAYQSGLIKATENFKLGVAAATGGIFLFYVAGWIASLFGFSGLMNMHSVTNASPLSIGISVFVVIIAALNLVMDFDFIESGVDQRAPKYMEWYAAFGLLVTLVWLYVEMLRLLAKLQER